MKAYYHPKFKKALRNCPKEVQQKLFKQVNYLTDNIRHPSLRAKKYDKSRGTWQARVDQNFRFYFFIKKDSYILFDIRRHPK